MPLRPIPLVGFHVPLPASFLCFLAAMHLLVALAGTQHGLQPARGILAMHQVASGLADQLSERQRNAEDKIGLLLPKPADLSGEGTDLGRVPDLLRVELIGHDPARLQPCFGVHPARPCFSRREQTIELAWEAFLSRASRSSRFVKYSIIAWFCLGSAKSNFTS
jgi:hypothetical protein